MGKVPADGTAAGRCVSSYPSRCLPAPEAALPDELASLMKEHYRRRYRGLRPALQLPPCPSGHGFSRRRLRRLRRRSARNARHWSTGHHSSNATRSPPTRADSPASPLASPPPADSPSSPASTPRLPKPVPAEVAYPGYRPACPSPSATGSKSMWCGPAFESGSF